MHIFAGLVFRQSACDRNNPYRLPTVFIFLMQSQLRHSPWLPRLPNQTLSGGPFQPSVRDCAWSSFCRLIGDRLWGRHTKGERIPFVNGWHGEWFRQTRCRLQRLKRQNFWRSYDEIGKKSADLCGFRCSSNVGQLQLWSMLWWRKLRRCCHCCPCIWMWM